MYTNKDSNKPADITQITNINTTGTLLADFFLFFFYCLTADENISPGKKKVHFENGSRERQQDGQTATPHEMILQRLQVAIQRTQTLRKVERGGQLKSRQLLGIR